MREELIDEVTRLREELARAERTRRDVERERDRLQRRHDRLKDQLDAARRAGCRQAAPFTKPVGRVQAARQGVGPAGRMGAGRTARGPAHRRAVRGARAAGRHLGPQATTLAGWCHKGLGLPLGRVQRILRTQCGRQVTRGSLAHLCVRVATRATPTDQALCAEIRQSPVVSPDETGWKIGRVLHWLWVAATPTTTVYRIGAGRGFDDAAALLGADFAGVLVRDGWAPSRRFTRATHQTCLAHLLRSCRLLHLDHPRSALPLQIQALLQRALALREQRAPGIDRRVGRYGARGAGGPPGMGRRWCARCVPCGRRPAIRGRAA